MLNIQILFTNYDIITDFLNLAFSSEHFISIKHRILTTFTILTACMPLSNFDCKYFFVCPINGNDVCGTYKIFQHDVYLQFIHKYKIETFIISIVCTKKTLMFLLLL
jgi:hypothetical protein